MVNFFRLWPKVFFRWGKSDEIFNFTNSKLSENHFSTKTLIRKYRISKSRLSKPPHPFLRPWSCILFIHSSAGPLTDTPRHRCVFVLSSSYEYRLLLDFNICRRRLFDENGKELTSLRSLKRDQVVYASSGESWIDPRVTRIEHQRRHLLTQLTNDVSMIRAFCAMRNPQGGKVFLLCRFMRTRCRVIVCNLQNDFRQTF